MDIFEHASYAKLRFTTSKGELTTEDLWDLSLRTLDTIAKSVNHVLLAEQEESFLPAPLPRKATHHELRLNILKHIIAWRVAKDAQAKTRAEQQATLARLKTLALQKHDEAFAAQSLEEITQQIAALEAQVS